MHRRQRDRLNAFHYETIAVRLRAQGHCRPVPALPLFRACSEEGELTGSRPATPPRGCIGAVCLEPQLLRIPGRASRAPSASWRPVIVTPELVTITGIQHCSLLVQARLPSHGAHESAMFERRSISLGQIRVLWTAVVMLRLLSAVAERASARDDLLTSFRMQRWAKLHAHVLDRTARTQLMFQTPR